MGFFKRNVEHRGDQKQRRRGRGGHGPKNRVGPAKKKVKFDEPKKRKDEEEITSSSGEEDAEAEELMSLELEEGENEKGEQFEMDQEEEDGQKLAFREAKRLLESVKQAELDHEDNDVEQFDEFGSVAERLRLEAQAKMAKMHRAVAADTRFGSEPEPIVHRGHRLSPICVCFSSQGDFLVSCSKDGAVVKYDLKKRCRVGHLRLESRKKGAKSQKKQQISEGESGPTPAHSAPVLCCEVSPGDKYLVTGDAKGLIKVWDFATLAPVKDLHGHRASVTSLRFRRQCAALELFSSSADKSIKVWSLDELGLMNTLYGHQDAVQALDLLQWPRVLGCGGMDKSCRMFKILEDSHLVFNGFADCVSIDCVAMINEEHFVSGNVDGSLYVWSTARKKPVYVQRRAHGCHSVPVTTASVDDRSYGDNDPAQQSPATVMGESRWISALACLPYTDLVASGSSDGNLRLWSVAQDYKSMKQTDSFQLPGFINDIRFSPDGRWVACAVGQEHKRGRWWTLKGPDGVRNRVVVIPLVAQHQQQRPTPAQEPAATLEERREERTMTTKKKGL